MSDNKYFNGHRYASEISTKRYATLEPCASTTQEYNIMNRNTTLVDIQQKR